MLWLIRVIVRLLLPMLFQKMVYKAQQQANRQYQQSRDPRPDGRIRVDYVPPREKNEKVDKLGDFVDYEEVK